ncbi:transporter substrate-binding domain-containing protein [Rhodobacter calidifons]|uniref:Transporter substrate-binding domain-containing protein n=1 Tax=Rhodobacter calidifons TaxID=2715277 RepID=A0ABX0G2L4_9RHOB|nr:transporter substrate-binding domain-containing protein [Rhodobacter calidifons]NHB75237.1 transporter substrate-binding domain-containing protein [Rhodobacter calidifons]
MACAGAIASVVAGLVLAASGPVVIGTDAPFPAYTYLDEAGVITGFERDVMDQVCARAALSCTWELAYFDQLIPGVMSGRFDVVLGGMAVTDDRRALVDFTTPYHGTDPEEWYIGPPGAPLPAMTEVAVQSGTVHEAHLRRMGYRHVAFPTEPQVLEAVVSGRVGLALGPFHSRPDIHEFIAAEGLEFLYPEMIPDDGVAMAVCKGNTELLGRLDGALDAMRRDGTLARPENRWFE